MSDTDISTTSYDVERVLLALPRSRVEAIEATLAGYLPRAPTADLERVLLSAWHDARARRHRELDAWGATRDELLVLLAGDALADEVARAPDPGRRWAIDEALRHAQRLQALRRLDAPAIVLAGTRRVVADAVMAIDPRRPLPEEPAPALVTLDPRDGVVTHAWLELVLELSRVSGGTTTSRETVSLSPAEDTTIDGYRPGLDYTAFSVTPDLRLWCPEAWTLPRTLDGGRVVVGEAGGPPSWLVQGDLGAPCLAPEVVHAARALPWDMALVAFTRLETGIDVAWSER